VHKINFDRFYESLKFMFQPSCPEGCFFALLRKKNYISDKLIYKHNRRRLYAKGHLLWTFSFFIGRW
jgi:hypothetical protein